MNVAAEYIDRIHAHGGVLIVITAMPATQPYVRARVESNYRGRPDIRVLADADMSNWSAASTLSDIHATADFGEQMKPTDPAVKIGLGPSMWQGRFGATLEAGYNNETWYISLATNRYDKDVAAVLVPRKDSGSGLVVFLPPVARIDEVIFDLVNGFLQRVAPELYELGDASEWTSQDAYEHDSVRELQEEVTAVRARAESDIADLESQIATQRDEHQHLHTLLTGTGDPLVAAIITTLKGLGFSDVRDVDAEKEAAGDDGRKREDLHIFEDGRSPILGEVKGIGGLPKESNALQVGKYLAPRIKEWETTKLRGLSIVNHQRHLPPAQREHVNVFQDDVLTTAKGQEITLLTTWELFVLARNARRLGWSHEQVRPIFYADGRPDLIPSHYVPDVSVMWCPTACWLYRPA